MGHRVSVGYLKEGIETPKLSGVTPHCLKSISNYDPILLWKLVRLIRRIRPDIIHTWILQMDILGGIAARITKTPWILREPSSAMAYSPTWKNRLRVLIGCGASTIVSNSLGGNEYWKSQLPHKRHRLVPNGLPLEEISRVQEDLPFDIPEPKAPIILYVGRLSSDITAAKNLRAFLEILAGIKQKNKIMGVLCGTGPQRSELERLRHTLGLDGDVYFTGHLPHTQVWSLMKKASVFLSLSAFEGRPNSVIEAMACGCPMVLSDIQAHREILDEHSAVFVNPSNVQDAIESILVVLHNTEAAQIRARIAMQKSQEWSITAIASRWETVYKESI